MYFSIETILYKIMRFWEDFFSTDKIIYPSMGAFIGGVIGYLSVILTSLNNNEAIIIVLMLIGFIVGNLIKINKIQANK